MGIRDDVVEVEIPSSEPEQTEPSASDAGALFQDGTLEEMLEENGTGAWGLSATTARKGLSTMWGVFLPCLQNILGVILFIRLPWIAGQAGTFQATIIVVGCAAASFLTALSLSAIATNGRISAGGPYFVISRNLGQEVGAAVGVLFYTGTTVASTMYVLGAVEAFQKAFGFEDQFTFDMQVEALAVMLTLAIVVTVGIRYVNMAAGVFLGTVLLSILAYVVGMIIFVAGGSLNGANSLTNEDRVFGDNVGASYEKDPETGLTPTFFSLLALFYPSVTGIMAGTNRSALLRDAGRSIPRGTLGAIATTTAIYVGTVWLFGAFVSNETLKTNKLVVAAAAWPHPMLVNVGIIMSSIGAALQCLTGAPQLLSAIAHDKTVPFLIPFAAAPGTTPRRAIWLTWFIASIACLAGNLDFITPIISMMFLLMYGTVNLSCFVLTLLRQPGFRPTWRYFHWGTALAGTLSCLGFMMIISWYSALGAFFLAGALYAYVSCSDASAEWGDVRDGVRFKVARDALLAMRERRDLHPKNWVPQLLAVVELDKKEGAPLEAQEPLLDLAAQLKKGRGLTLISGIIRGGDLQRIGPHVHSLELALQQRGEMHGLLGIASVATSDLYRHGVWSAMQHSGLGPMQANVVMLPWLAGGAHRWRTDPAVAEDYIGTLRGVTSAGRSLMVLKLGEGITMPSPKDREEGTIDVWWISHDLGLIFLLPYLLSLHRVWRRCKLRLFSVASDVDPGATLERTLTEHLRLLRIDAEVEVVTLEAQEMLDWKAISQRTMDMETWDRLLQQLGQQEPTLTMVARGESHARKRSTSAAPGGTLALASMFEEAEAEEAAEIDMAKRQVGEDREPKDGEEEKEGNAASATGGTEGDGGSGSTENEAASNRLAVAAKINATVRSHSDEARLVVMNLPLGRDIEGHRVIEHIEALTEGIDRALLIRGCGREVVTKLG